MWLVKIIATIILTFSFFAYKKFLKICMTEYNKFSKEEREEVFTAINTQIMKNWRIKLLIIVIITIGIVFIKKNHILINHREEKYMMIVYLKVFLFQILNFILTLLEVTLAFLTVSLIRIKNLPKEISIKAKIIYTEPYLTFWVCFFILKTELIILFL